MVGSSEVDPHMGELPTSKILGPIYEKVVERTWVDINTGKELADYDPQASATTSNIFIGPAAMLRSETPNRTTFMSLGHVMVALLLGYVGGKFALVVQRHSGDIGI